MTGTRRIAHGDVPLVLHARRAGAGVPLLLLHALGGSSADWDVELDVWPGPVFALDFAGHGESAWRPGAAYTPELFAADADAALAAIGRAAVAGAGLGAYVALLLAGTRPALVPAALLLPGRGLDGGGPHPAGRRFAGAGTEATSHDPMVTSCEIDVRPPDYARAFGDAARGLFLAEDGGTRPPWWMVLRDVPNVRRIDGDRAAALVALAR
jgi:pimeloyl-ACP methyl ester carboxylesterase